MKTVNQYISDKKEKWRQQDVCNLRSDFKVQESNGFIYLTHCGVAFRKVDSRANAEDIARELNNARDVAIEFEGL